MMERLWYKKHNCEVDVFWFDMANNQALVWSPEQAGKTDGYGWLKVPLKNLLPTEYVNHVDGSYLSKSEKNRIMEQIVSTGTVWYTSDGERFVDKDEAITYQRFLMKEEENF